jgi:hypothetical protein
LDRHRDTQRLWWSQGFSIIAMGIGIGWLVGHSASPVVGGVISSLLGLSAGVVTGLRSIRHSDTTKILPTFPNIDARPAALLIVSIALSATAAMVVRAHHLFEPEFIRNAYHNAYNKAASDGRVADIATVDPHGAYLFSVRQKECNTILSVADNQKAFVDQILLSSLPNAKQFVARIHDPQTLLTIVEVLCDRH